MQDNDLTLSPSAAAKQANQCGLARQAFFKKSGKVIIPFTVKEILDEQIAYKLA